MAVGGRLHPRAGGAHRGRQEGAGRGGRPLPARQRRAGAGDRGDRAGAQARRRPADGVCAAGGRSAGTLDVEVLHRPALPRERPALRRAHRVDVLLQLAGGRLRDLPRLRPRDRRRLGAGDPGRAAHAARRRCQAHPDPRLERMPGRPHAPCRERRHPARHRLEQAHTRAEGLGDRGGAQLQGGQLEQAVVRHPPLLPVPGEQGVQDAHPCAALQVPQLHHLPGVRRRAAEDRIAAVARGQQGRCRRRGPAAPALHAPGRGLVAGTAGGAARPAPTRPDAAADRPAGRFLRPAGGARCS